MLISASGADENGRPAVSIRWSARTQIRSRPPKPNVLVMAITLPPDDQVIA